LIVSRILVDALLNKMFILIIPFNALKRKGVLLNKHKSVEKYFFLNIRKVKIFITLFYYFIKISQVFPAKKEKY
jgi:hypothetical protein